MRLAFGFAPVFRTDAACASLPCVFTCQRAGGSLHLRVAFASAPAPPPFSGEAGFYSIAGPASTSFFCGAAKFPSHHQAEKITSATPTFGLGPPFGEAGLYLYSPTQSNPFFPPPSEQRSVIGEARFLPLPRLPVNGFFRKTITLIIPLPRARTRVNCFPTSTPRPYRRAIEQFQHCPTPFPHFRPQSTNRMTHWSQRQPKTRSRAEKSGLNLDLRRLELR